MPRNCSTSEDLDSYFDISRKSRGSELDHEIEEFGCKLENCVSNKWMRKLFTKSSTLTEGIDYVDESKPGIAMIGYFMPDDQVRKSLVH